MKKREYQLLLDINIAIAKTKTRTDLIRTIFDEIKPVFPFDCPGLFTIDTNGEYHTELSDDQSVLDPINRYVYQNVSSNTYPHKGSAIEYWSKLKHPEIYDLREFNDNVAQHPHFPHMLEAGLKQTIAGPLRHGGKSIGILCFSSSNLHQYSEGDIPMFQAISDQLAIATSNILAREETELRDRENVIQVAITNSVNEEPTWEKRLERVSKHLKEVISFDGVAFVSVGKRFGHFKYGFEEIEPSVYRTIDLAPFLKMTGLEEAELHNFFQETTLTQPILWDSDESSNNHVVVKKAQKAFRAQSAMIFPLKLDNEDFYIIFYSRRSETFNQLHLALFNRIQSSFVLSIEKLLLFEEIIRLNKLLKEEKTYLKEQVNEQYNFSEMVGTSLLMNQVFEKVKIVRDTDTTVLILGETGTGKELIARALHNSSARKDKPLIKVNCASLPKELIESELFGHEKGAFTGALNQRIGKFELASGGTIFLDEIGELPLELQPKLLRVIQEKEFERLGGHETIKVETRIIAATNRNLEEAVEQGKFRPDLYYRLSTFPVELPPLRDRAEDIEPLANYFVAKNCKKLGKEAIQISKAAFRELVNYHWPGNIRELEHVIERSVLLTNGNFLQLALTTSSKKKLAKPQMGFKTLFEAERELIFETLKKCDGKVRGEGGAASFLDVPPSTLEYRMKRVGISRQMVLMDQGGK